MISKLLASLALAFSLNGYACNELAEYAYQTAISDGHHNPKYVVGVLNVESKLGEHDNFRVVKHLSSTFYGAGQLTIGAAKAVMQRFPKMWESLDTKTEEELKAKLILDDKFNVQVTSKYLLMMGVNQNLDRGIAAYNVGIGAVKTINPSAHAYTLKVKHAAKSCAS